mgnify:CR=1 FL=1
MLGAAASTLLLWNHRAESFGVVIADNYALFVIWTIIIGAVAAPVVIGGMVYVNSGDYRARPGNVLLAFGVD